MRLRYRMAIASSIALLGLVAEIENGRAERNCAAALPEAAVSQEPGPLKRCPSGVSSVFSSIQ